jgi:hypothetical protein
MKNMFRDLYLSTARMNPQQVRLVVFVLTLVMFVLAAGAPEAGTEIIR